MPDSIGTTPGTSSEEPIAEWWLDDAALPERVWAALVPGMDGIRVHLDDGSMMLFEEPEDAIAWLRAEEFSTLEALKADGEVPQDVRPPSGFFEVT